MTSRIKPLQNSSSPDGIAKTGLKALEAAVNRHLVRPAVTGLSRLKRWSPRQPAMLGAFADRAAAVASLPARQIATYDHEDVADVNFRVMCAVRVWDYPVMFWLEKLHVPGMQILDAGGHFGTKYIAFSGHLPLQQVVWTVYDLPEIVRAARKAQTRGEVPQAVGFTDDLAGVAPSDLLLASGLLQYLDLPFDKFLARMPNRPQHIVLNKVATRDGPSVTTLERIGPARVPYQIRCRSVFEAQILGMGYRIADSWDIPSLGHVIDTHPELGRSVSRGYMLHRTE
jgi:putative methyltransferase (TIGR04325 family)